MTNSEPAVNQPDELNALTQVVKEFMDRYKTLQNEVELLKEDEKNLIDEFSDKLDIKTLRAAMRTVKIQKTVAHRSTYDTFVEILDTLE